jgi:hypothetical protein
MERPQKGLFEVPFTKRGYLKISIFAQQTALHEKIHPQSGGPCCKISFLEKGAHSNRQ